MRPVDLLARNVPDGGKLVHRDREGEAYRQGKQYRAEMHVQGRGNGHTYGCEECREAGTAKIANTRSQEGLGKSLEIAGATGRVDACRVPVGSSGEKMSRGAMKESAADMLGRHGGCWAARQHGCQLGGRDTGAQLCMPGSSAVAGWRGFSAGAA